MKTLKRILLCIICVLMLLSVCSCDFIDELRETTAYIQKDGTIKYDDKTFIKFDVKTVYVYEMDGDYNLNVCHPGEPILWPVFMEAMGRRWDYSYLNKQQTVISSYYDSAFYVRSDVYRQITEELVSFDKGNCIIRFDDYRLDDGGKTFSKEDSKALLDILKQPPVSIESLGDYNYNGYGSFYKYSENSTFYEYSGYSLAECDGKYYIADDKYGMAYLASGRAEQILKDIGDIIRAFDEGIEYQR